MSGVDAALGALAAGMSSALLATSTDGATEALIEGAQGLAELVADLLLAAQDQDAAPVFTGWSSLRV